MQTKIRRHMIWRLIRSSLLANKILQWKSPPVYNGLNILKEADPLSRGIWIFFVLFWTGKFCLIAEVYKAGLNIGIILQKKCGNFTLQADCLKE